MAQLAQLALAPNLGSSWKPVSPEAVRPTQPDALQEEDIQFNARAKAGLEVDEFQQILQQHDARIEELLEDWMSKMTSLVKTSLERSGGHKFTKQISPAAVAPVPASFDPVSSKVPSDGSVHSTHSNASHASHSNPEKPRRRSHPNKVTVRVRTADLHKEDDSAVATTSMNSVAFVVQQGCLGDFDKRPEESWLRFLRRKIALFVEGWFFEAFFASIIVTNSVFIAVQVEWASQNPGGELPLFLFLIASGFTMLFTLELLLRFIARGIWIFCGDDWGWMLLDTIIVATSLFEFIIEVVVSNDEEGQANVLTNMRLLRILRIAKITRAFRIVRLVRFVRSLRTLLLCIGRTLRAMAWSAVLLGLIIFLFGLIFTDICTEHLSQATEFGLLEDFLKLRAGSLLDTMHTLFGSITGGFTWIEARDAFDEISIIYGFLFEVYIAFCNFAVLNVMTGVFCQSAIESAEKDHELNLESVQNEKEKYFRAVRRLFTQLDENSDGGITKKEFERAWSDPVLQTVFDALEISSTDAWDLFRQLDRDGSGEVDVDEFLEGCMMIKGPARSIDVVCIKKDLLLLREKLGLR